MGSMLRAARLPVLLVLAGMFLVRSATAQDLSQEAGDFLVDLNVEAVSELNDPALSDEEKRQRFLAMVRRSFDIARISKFVLGVNWRRATPDQRDEFMSIFEQVNFDRFIPMFTQNANQKFAVLKSRQDKKNPRLYFVSSTIKRVDGVQASIDWRLMRRDGQFKILDVTAEGVSMVLTLRNEYGSVVKNSGVDGLIAQLRRKVKSTSSEPETEPSYQ